MSKKIVIWIMAVIVMFASGLYVYDYYEKKAEQEKYRKFLEEWSKPKNQGYTSTGVDPNGNTGVKQ